jgi:hypothetical protein
MKDKSKRYKVDSESDVRLLTLHSSFTVTVTVRSRKMKNEKLSANNTIKTLLLARAIVYGNLTNITTHWIESNACYFRANYIDWYLSIDINIICIGGRYATLPGFTD